MTQKKPLRVLIIEDSEDDTQLLIRRLRQGEFELLHERVENADAMQEALHERQWDLILCDYRLPKFSGTAALALLKETGIDLPFIIVSGTIGEGIAVEAMKSGAHDYVMKDKLERLIPAIERELKEAAVRRERRQAESQLRESEERFRLAFENANIGMCLVSMEGRLLKVNHQMSLIFGYSGEELEGMTVNDIIHPDDLDISPDSRSSTAPGKFSGTNFERRYIHKSGRIVWCQVTSSLVQDAQGRPLSVISHIQDITERLQGFEKLNKALEATVQAIAMLVETKDPYTSGHQKRVADLTQAIAGDLGMADDRIAGIQMASVIHDIGKISVPTEILSKPTKLTATEFNLIKIHPQAGYSILKGIEFPWPVARIILEHHERMDGSGYPQGLRGDEILPESRILQVADVVESMASHRPYRPALGIEAAIREITQHKGILYDASVVDACERLFSEKGFQWASLSA